MNQSGSYTLILWHNVWLSVGSTQIEVSISVPSHDVASGVRKAWVLYVKYLVPWERLCMWVSPSTSTFCKCKLIFQIAIDDERYRIYPHINKLLEYSMIGEVSY